MTVPIGWNNLILEKNRLESPNKNTRRPTSLTPTHIVLHITGSDDFSSVKNTFINPNGVSAHYLITKDGTIFQFVQDNFRAWHAGIDSNTRALYKKGRGNWQCYLKFFSWFRGYPPNSIFLDGDLKPVWDKTEAVYVARADGSPWSQFDYFNMRWPDRDVPINFDIDADPNNYSIGIEILGVGSRKTDANEYTTAMYESLNKLVESLSNQYSIPMKKGFIVGHEDVNPIGRFGWDPGLGFDWSVVHR